MTRTTSVLSWGNTTIVVERTKNWEICTKELTKENTKRDEADQS